MIALFTRMALTVVSSLALAIGTSGSLYASTIYFTSKTAWESAVTDVTTETYETYGFRSLAGDFQGSNVTLLSPV